MIYPCLTLLYILNHSLSPTFTLTQAELSTSIILIPLNSLPPHHTFSTPATKLPYHTPSPILQNPHTLLRFFSRAFSPICFSEKIGSTYPTPALKSPLLIINQIPSQSANSILHLLQVHKTYISSPVPSHLSVLE